MKKNDKINLDSISNIDEKIVDEVTDKKISLLQKLSGNTKNLRKRFIAIGSIAASFALMFSVLLVIIIPMLGSDVPVYQGMTIRQDSASSVEVQKDGFSDHDIKRLSISKTRGFTLLGSSNGNGNAYGHDKDNHKDKDDKPKNDIEDIVVIDVKTDDEVRYYVKPGETFIIEIHIDNPRDYEIQSFTLNGQKYANYMFKEGSTMELLLLEVTAPSEPGYVEYTIDAIKYIDGTEIKDVDMSSGDKSVKAGIAYPTAPSAAVISQSILPTSIELSVNVTDPYSLIGENELAIYLTDGESIISSKPLTVGANNITFDNLTMNKTYEYGVVTAYDLVDGKNLHKEWLLTSTITTADAFGISNATPTQDSISFEVEKIGEVGEITSISLFDAETDDHVASGGADIREFTELLSGHTYNLYVDFKYTANGEEISDWVAIKGIKTVAKTAPTLTFSENSSDKTSIIYSVVTTDTDGILNVSCVELIKDGEAVKDNGTALSGKFDSLLSNNSYTVKVSYTYDLNDGQGVITETITKDVTTLAKIEPTVTFGDITVTDSAITGKINFADPDSTGEITSVDIYKGDVFAQNNAEKALDFSNIESYTDYNAVVTYTYDLGDGVGLQTKTATHEFKTAPHLEFVSCTVVNTSAVSDGETIFLQINITNPNKVVYQKIVVNGKEYNVVKNSSTETMLYCEIVNNGQFEGGETALTVEKVIAELGGKTYTIEPKPNNTASVFINGKLEVEGIGAVVLRDGQYTPTDYVFPSDQAYIMLTLSNKTGYTINSFEATLTNDYYYGFGSLLFEPTKVDDEHYVVELPSEWTKEGVQHYDLLNVKYSVGGSEKTITLKSMLCNFVVLESDEIQYISTPSDLANMNSGNKYYELTNDIDLSGIEWIGNEFYGVFNGRGHSIKNMSFVGTTNSQNMGLFSTGEGVICNLHLESVNYIVTMAKDNPLPEFSFGGIIGFADAIVLDNCSIDESSFINIEGDNAGGLVGRSYEVTIRNCANYSTITGNNYVGGIIGEIGRGAIENCANFGTVIYNNPSSWGDESVGGIVTACYGSIHNCISQLVDVLGPFHSEGRQLVFNCYTFGENANVSQFNSKSFYTDTLGWDETVWNLDDLDIENGKYPTLK